MSDAGKRAASHDRAIRDMLADPGGLGGEQPDIEQPDIEQPDFEPRARRARRSDGRGMLQISLGALLSMTVLAAGVTSAWMTRNLGGLVVLLAILFGLAWRRRDADARRRALLFYGGALGLCGGLLLSHANNDRLAFAGLCVAGIGCFFALHGACGPLLDALARAVVDEE